jgi:hypothetical protein
MISMPLVADSANMVTSSEASKMAAGPVGDMAMTPPELYGGFSISMLLYTMAAVGALSLLGSLYCFYKVGRTSADGRSKIKKIFVTGLLLFLVGSFLLAYFSYIAGRHQIPYLGNPGFDPRAT